MINPATIQLNTYEVIINLIELFFSDLNLVFQTTFSKAGAELGTAQPQLVSSFSGCSRVTVILLHKLSPLVWPLFIILFVTTVFEPI